MTKVLRELPLSYAMLSERRRCGSASAVHEPNPAGPSARATSPRRSPESSTSRVRLHLKPGQKGTKPLLAQYGDRLICVRYRYDAQRKKRFNDPWSSSSPNAIGNRPPGLLHPVADCHVGPGAIQVEMLASTVGCRHPVPDEGVAVQYGSGMKTSSKARSRDDRAEARLQH
jgi:hypothetical protein